MYLCGVIIKYVQLKTRKMTDKEIEELIEKKKRNISDYLMIAEKLNLDKKTVEKQIDMMLEDISRLMKKRK